MIRFLKLIESLSFAGFIAATALTGNISAETVQGYVTKVDSAARTVIVHTAEGTDHTFHVTEHAMVRGAEGTPKESWKGLKDGTEVVAHYSVKGSEDVATGFGRVGKDGMKVMEGTVVDTGKGAKTLVLKSADGTEHTFTAADHAVTDVSKLTARDAENSEKVTVYYTETAGKKIAHFFKKSL